MYLIGSKLPFTNREKLLGLAGKHFARLNDFKPVKLNREIENNAVLIALFESLGDIVASEPVARRMKEKYPDRPIYWVVSSKYSDVVKYNHYLKGIIEITSVAQWIDLKENLPKSVTIIDLHFKYRGYIMDRGKVYENDNAPDINAGNMFSCGNSLVEIFSKTAGLEPIDDAPLFYQRAQNERYKFNPHGKYIAIHAISAQWKKDWPSEKWRELIEKLTVEMPDMKIVELGFFPLINTSAKNYINKTGLKSIQDSADIISNASAFIGIDSSLAHIANAFNIPGVILMNSGYMPFSGNYQKQINSKIIFSDSVINITVEEVLTALKNVIK